MLKYHLWPISFYSYSMIFWLKYFFFSSSPTFAFERPLLSNDVSTISSTTSAPTNASYCDSSRTEVNKNFLEFLTENWNLCLQNKTKSQGFISQISFRGPWDLLKSKDIFPSKFCFAKEYLFDTFYRGQETTLSLCSYLKRTLFHQIWTISFE